MELKASRQDVALLLALQMATAKEATSISLIRRLMHPPSEQEIFCISVGLYKINEFRDSTLCRGDQ